VAGSSNDDRLLASVLEDFGQLLGEQKRFPDALHAYEEALAIQRRRAGQQFYGPRVDLGSTLGRAASLYKDAGRTVEAEEALKEEIAIWQTLSRNEQDGVSLSLGEALDQLASLYLAFAREEAARSLYDQLGQLCTDVLARRGKDEPSFRLTHLMNNVGRYYSDTKRYRDAITVLETVVERLRHSTTVGREQLISELRLPWALYDLARAYRDAGRLTEAGMTFAEAVSAQRSVYSRSKDPHNQRSLALFLDALAQIYSDTARHKEAITTRLEQIDILRAIGNAVTTDEDWLATSLNSLAINYDRLSEHADADRRYMESLAIRRRLAGGKDLTAKARLIVVLENVAGLYRVMNKDGGEKYDSEALIISSELVNYDLERFGPNHASRLLRRANSLSREEHTTNEIEDEYRAALEMWKQLDSKHPGVHLEEQLRAMSHLASLLALDKKLNKSEALLKDILARSNNSNNPMNAIDATYLLAFVYLQSERFQDAEQWYKKCLLLVRALPSRSADA
jgi:tetratricopeptide (TPR) repeat protein